MIAKNTFLDFEGLVDSAPRSRSVPRTFKPGQFNTFSDDYTEASNKDIAEHCSTTCSEVGDCRSVCANDDDNKSACAGDAVYEKKVTLSLVDMVSKAEGTKR